MIIDKGSIMDLFVVLLIIVGLFVAGMLAMMIGVLFFVGIFWLGLIIIQIILAIIIKAITGKSPGWLLSKTTFKIEAVIVIIIIFVIYGTPVKTSTLIPESCATITYSTDLDDGGNNTVYSSEQVE